MPLFQKKENNQALEYLEKALEKGYENLEKIQSDPDLEEIRNDPTYKDIMEIWHQKINQT